MGIGFLVNNLGANQLAFQLIKNGNKYCREHGKDVLVFYEDQIPPCHYLQMATMPIVDACNYKGSLVATSLSTANKLLHLSGTKKKYFYVWSLEWIFLDASHRRYEELASIYQNSKLKLIARSAEHATAIENAWQRAVYGIVENVDIGQFHSILI
jgi:hypothetical protein